MMHELTVDGTTRFVVMYAMMGMFLVLVALWVKPPSLCASVKEETRRHAGDELYKVNVSTLWYVTGITSNDPKQKVRLFQDQPPGIPELVRRNAFHIKNCSTTILAQRVLSWMQGRCLEPTPLSGIHAANQIIKKTS